jgi:predicted RNase H-like nuclease (RuvC/YqgF family)
MKQTENCKRVTDMAQRAKNDAQFEKQKVVAQLQNLFVLYNKQKGTIDQLSYGNKNFEAEKRSLKEHIEYLEKDNIRLKAENSKEFELRKELTIKNNVISVI